MEQVEGDPGDGKEKGEKKMFEKQFKGETTVLVIDDNPKTFGRLIFKDGTLRFEGNMEESAKVFLVRFQQTIDDYIAEKKKGCSHANTPEGLAVKVLELFCDGTYDKDPREWWLPDCKVGQTYDGLIQLLTKECTNANAT